MTTATQTKTMPAGTAAALPVFKIGGQPITPQNVIYCPENDKAGLAPFGTELRSALQMGTWRVQGTAGLSSGGSLNADVLITINRNQVPPAILSAHEADENLRVFGVGNTA